MPAAIERDFPQKEIADAAYQLRKAALGDDPFGKDPLMPHILECVKACTTLGEIIGVLRDTWGEYVEQNINFRAEKVCLPRSQ